MRVYHYSWQVALGCSRVRFVDTIVRLSKLVWLTLNVWAKFVNVDGMSGFPFLLFGDDIKPFYPFPAEPSTESICLKMIIEQISFKCLRCLCNVFLFTRLFAVFPNRSWSTDYTRFPREILTNDPKLICCWGKSLIYHVYTRNDRTRDILLRDS